MNPVGIVFMPRFNTDRNDWEAKYSKPSKVGSDNELFTIF